ncbi:efflux RND transporter periplasmic adaptor subunit [bacterium]|nr:efflux RND transporter periplasmic adaptor subunit [bacterium]
MRNLIQSAVFLIYAAYVMSCNSSNAGSSSEKTIEKESVVFVKTEKVIASDFAETIKLTGVIESLDNIIVPAEESGRIVEWHAAKGSYVQKNQALAKIDDAAIKSAYDAALANYNMADVNYRKQKSAFEEQAISELQLKNLEYQRDAAKAQADLAKLRLDKTEVLSPIDGVLNERYVDAGELAVLGQPVAQVIDMNRLKVMVGVPERYAKSLRMNLEVEFTVDAYPGDQFKGKISFVGSAVNADNRTIPVEIYFNNVQNKLKPQMIAVVNLQLATTSKAILISQDYVQQIDMGRLVVYVAKNGVAEERAVQVGGTDNHRVRILSGLREGEDLITVGYQNVIHNQKIKIQE